MMKMKKPYKHVTEESWKQIKAMMEYGVPMKQLREITGRGYSTLEIVALSGSFTEYKSLGHAKWEKYKKEAASSNDEDNGTAQATAVPHTTELTLQDIYDLLKEIRDSLARKKVIF